TKGSKGTGLGMMVVFSIVRAMDGNVRVKSEVGKGTVFRFTFPNFKSKIHNE
ncbi:ATP-binding protein, partial [Escherichia coli]|nr:ATP-binding protein [Escherichia coli]